MLVYGAAIADEASPLLLAAHSHSPSGTVRPLWHGRLMRVQDFTVDQGATIGYVGRREREPSSERMCGGDR